MVFQSGRARNFFVGAMAVAVVMSLTATSALAVWVPPEGIVKFKLTDAANLYSSGDTPDGRSELFPMPMSDAEFLGTYEAGLNAALAGTRDFTAFEVTTFRVDTDPFGSLPAGTNLTGVATFLEIELIDNTIDLAGRHVTLALGDDEGRPHQLPNGGIDPVSGNALIGRIFLFDNNDADAGDFAQTNSTANDGIGGTPSDVLFSSGLGTVDCGGFECDALDNFTGGTLVATGSFVSAAMLGDGTPVIANVLTKSSDAGVSFTGIVFDTDLVIDGGLWFDQGVMDRATFQVSQFGFDGSGTDPIEGDQNVWDGGWQIASEDPITFESRSPIPEPITGGLSLLALGGLTGYLRRRRMA